MRFCAILGVILVLGASGCTLHTSTRTTGAPPATVTTNPHMPVPAMALTVYRVTNGKLAPSVVHVPRTQAVATAALHALGVDAPVTIADGTATVALAHATDEQVAEIVYTLTQFPTVQRVDVAGRAGVTRDEVAAYKPPIVVDDPAAGSTVSSAFRVSGTAMVYEATLTVQLVRDGVVLEKKTVTATAGAPERGTFETTLHGTAGDATIEVFEPSAEDGSPQHEVDVPVTISP